MLGEETMDPVSCASAVIRTPSDAAWDSKGATMYYMRAIINLCDSEGYLKPCDVKMPIAINSPALDGTGTLVAVRNSASRRGQGTYQGAIPRAGPSELHMEPQPFDQFVEVHDHGVQPVADHVRTSLENELRAHASQVGEVGGPRHSGFRLARTPPEKAENHQGPLGGAGVVGEEQRKSRAPRPAKGVASTKIKALKVAHATEVGAL